jgi:hypothetical protein
VHGVFAFLQEERHLTALHHRDFKLADLVALGQVGVEVVFARKDAAASAMCASTAKPNSNRTLDTAPTVHHRARCRAAPGPPAQAWVFGSAPKAVEARLKILLLVESWAWVSRPITTS